MRIAYVITRADAVGGASIHVRDLAEAAIARGHEAVVLLGGEGPVTEQLARAGVSFQSLRHLQREVDPAADARAYRELIGALRRLRPDLVSTHTAKAGWLGRAAAAKLRLPAIYTPHGWPVGDRISRAHGRFFGIAERVAARWARAIVCVCEYERQLALARRIAPEAKLHVVHNGVRETPLRAVPQAQPPRIVCVARFEPPKDHATLLEALTCLRDLDWQLDLVGDGPLEDSLRRQAASLGLGGRVTFLGYQADPAEVLSRAQIFVLCSRSEGFPRSILEAMRAGLPVVASDVGGVREAVADGATGFLTPGGDPQAVAAALENLIPRPDLRQLLGAAARQSYAAGFRLETMITKTFGVYAIVTKEAAKSKKYR